MSIREQLYQSPHDPKKPYYLGADIGGTNSNFGFFQLNGERPILILSAHMKSQEITNFEDAVKELLEYVYKRHTIIVKRACFAAAGVVAPTRDYCKPTNLPWELHSEKLIKVANLECAVIANDFEIIGHGLPLINQNDIVEVKTGNPVHKANRVIIGAGTGLGMCMLRWDWHSGRYMPLASEGGHSDFAPIDSEQWDLVQFIKKSENYTTPVSWEDVLSGYGIQRIYSFFSSQKKSSPKNDGPHPDEIFNSRNNDQASFATYTLYTKLYAQAARLAALNSLALAGVYIAGGIATHNVELFTTPLFQESFITNKKKKEHLIAIPIFVIKDYNISLYGAVEFMRLEGLCG